MNVRRNRIVYKLGLCFTLLGISEFIFCTGVFYLKLKSIAYNQPGKIIYDNREKLSPYDLYFESSFLEIPINLEYTYLKQKDFTFKPSVGLFLVIAWEDYSKSKNPRKAGKKPADFVYPDRSFGYGCGALHSDSRIAPKRNAPELPTAEDISVLNKLHSLFGEIQLIKAKYGLFAESNIKKLCAEEVVATYDNLQHRKMAFLDFLNTIERASYYPQVYQLLVKSPTLDFKLTGLQNSYIERLQENAR